MCLAERSILSWNNIELVKDGKIKITIQSYMKEAIVTFGHDLSRRVTLPLKIRLFNVTEGAEKMFDEKAATFHLTVAKPL